MRLLLKAALLRTVNYYFHLQQYVICIADVDLIPHFIETKHPPERSRLPLYHFYFNDYSYCVCKLIFVDFMIYQFRSPQNILYIYILLRNFATTDCYDYNLCLMTMLIKILTLESRTTWTFSRGPNLSKMLCNCRSLVNTLRPNTPRHLDGSGLSLVPMCRRRFDIGDLELGVSIKIHKVLASYTTIGL